MTRYKLLLLYAILFLSCDSLPSNEIDIKLPPVDNKLVFHGFLIDRDSTITIHLDNSVGFFEQDTLETALIGDLPGAQITVYSDDLLISHLSYIPLESRLSGEINTINNYTDTFPSRLDEYGTNFRISVKHPDFEDILAEQDLPDLPPNPEINLVEGLGTDISGNITPGLVISFQDPSDTENYYEVLCHGILKGSTQHDQRLIQVSSNNPVFKVRDEFFPSAGSLLMKDGSFNGSKFSFSFYFTQKIEPFETLIISWRSISKEWYQYLDSEREQDRLNGLLGNFAEPFNVISNISGGYGAFGVCRELVYTIKL